MHKSLAVSWSLSYKQNVVERIAFYTLKKEGKTLKHIKCLYYFLFFYRSHREFSDWFPKHRLEPRCNSTGCFCRSILLCRMVGRFMGENDTPLDRNLVPTNRSIGKLFIPSIASYYLVQVQLLVQWTMYYLSTH